ncbi:immunity-related GTPase family M protein 3-like [Peromyscus maniculatus bairdii]|uniref:immunity-related GTPase family M protein 3-like n=1 Tax=Peromyscus maniculatus bairdii TaxID=230844 RepID=UPI00077DE4C4|nr:immunity-related GTPase family M protein 1-like [Peromyscus maniculatus bairdii]
MHSVTMCVHKVWKAFIHLVNVAKSLLSGWFSRKSDSEPSYSSQITFSQDISEKIDKAVKEGNLLNVINVVNEVMQRMCGYQVRIAVTGDSGNGMSSFINALRFIGHEEEDSAPTGVVRTTQKPACYSSSSLPNVDLWDLPGTGVTAQSMENYLEEMDFEKYDLIIIIASEQFSSNHVKLAKAMQRMRKRFYVVWTKLDRDLGTSAHSEPQLLRSIQESIQENLQKEGVKVPPIFLVSSFEPSSHDFPKLRDTLKKDLSSIRYEDSLEILSEICDKSIDRKAFSLKEGVTTNPLETPVSRMCGAADLEESLETYQKSFGVDDWSLQQVAQRTGTLEMGYRAMRYQDLHKRDWRLRLMMCCPVVTFLKCLAFSLWYGLWNSVIRVFRHRRLQIVIELVAWDTKIFLRRVLKDRTLFP